MISDFVKGKKRFDYAPVIQQGIELHRAIDEFTDHHPLTREASAVFHSVYGLYAGALTDVVYDHFVANDPLLFPLDADGGAGALEAFAQRTYADLAGYVTVFPDRFARMFPYMKSQDWLSNYRHREGIRNSMMGLHRRAKYMPDPQEAFVLFETHYETIRTCYTGFFPALREYAQTTLMQLRGNTH